MRLLRRREGDTFVRLPFCALTAGEIDKGVRALAQVVRSL
jgi:hypothetical protein